MKRIILLVLAITSLSTAAQESVLLRLNYTTGDSYLVKVDSKQNMGAQGGVNTNMSMGMIVTEVNENNIKTESQILSVAMDMMQGGMTMAYDSTKKEEELDQMGKALKAQFDPMMKAVIHTSLDFSGNMIETKIEPEIAGMEQLTSNANTINYPKDKVSVGSSWTSENETQGMKMKTIYTVSSIADGIVTLDVSGDVTGAGTGTIKGKTTVDIKTGVPNSANLVVVIAVQGMEMTVTTNTTMTKV